MNERELLDGCRVRDPGAVTELVRRHQEPLARVVVRLVGSRAVAEELVQEAFLRALREIDRVDPLLGIQRWLFRIAINLARDHNRKHAAMPLTPEAREDQVPIFAVAAENPEQGAAAAEERRKFATALDGLPPRYREVLLLRYLEGLTFPEIARIVRLPVPALKMRALRARARLFALLQGEGR